MYHIHKSIVVLSLFFICTAASAQQVARSLAGTVALVKGTVTAADGSHPAGMPLAFMKGTERVNQTKTRPDGTFTMVLNPNATYRIVANAPGYFYHEDTLVIPVLSQFTEYPVQVNVKPLRDGQSLTIGAQVFLPRSSAIEANSKPELEQVVSEMHHNAKLSLTISVYPDKPVTGKKDAAQQKLVTDRATAIRSFLLTKNLPSSRYDINVLPTIVPSGRFEMMLGPEPAATGKKSKKPAPQAKAKPTMVPQYVEITAHLVP